MAEFSSASYRAVNPYNFIPLEEQPTRAPLTAYYPDATALKSGWLTVQIEATTPLIIPDGSKYHAQSLGYQNEHKSYQFFKLPDGRYGIPGSSLRGMLRSLYEAVSNSCMSLLPDDPKEKVSQRTPLYTAFHKRGILEYDAAQKLWRLWKARAYKNTVSRSEVEHGTYQGHRNAETVWFVPVDHPDTEGREDAAAKAEGFKIVSKGAPNAQKGLLQFSIPVDPAQDYHVSVLVKAGQSPEKEWNDARIPSRFQTGRDVFDSLYGSVYDTVHNIQKSRKQLEQRNPEAAAAIRNDPIPQNDLQDRMEKMDASGGMVPVYYMTVKRGSEDLYYLSGSAAGRVQQRRSWKQIMEPYDPCNSLEQLCPACALFGTAMGKGTKGRLRFTDAAQKTDYVPTPLTLPILGGPRPSSFEFYLRRPKDPSGAKPIYWNFDFYSVKTPDGHTEYGDLSAATPRGRKMYWHSEPGPENASMTGMNATMELMQPGARFEAQIFFDRITEQQLRDLIWVITLGDNRPGSPLQQKLGHGKPLGYGSVKMTVVEGKIRELNEDISMTLKPIDISEAPEPFAAAADAVSRIDTESVPVRSVLKMCNRNAVAGMPVHYPLKGDKYGVARIYEWFSQNRVNADTLETLPEPLDDVLALPSVQPPSPVSHRSKTASPARKQDASGASARRYTSSNTAARPTKKNWLNIGERVTGRVTEVLDSGFWATTESGKACFVFFRNIPGCKYGHVSQYVSIGESVELEFVGINETGRLDFRLMK